jgi:uncharacterized protein YcnI
MMRMKFSVALLFVASGVASLSAHLTVSPLQSKPGATQKYEARVHNEGKLAATAIDLEIPEGVTVTGVAKPAAGSYATKKTGDRITMITWVVEVPPSKYMALPFTATNPANVAELHWSLHEHLADGSVVDWSDRPGSKEKGSVTKLAPAVQ